MAETQIHAGGSSPAPLVYNVASTEEFTLLAVNATFDGSGAGSAWLPAVEVVSDSGQVIARHITGETVAAGGSAEATFAPFLRSTAAPAAGAEMSIASLNAFTTTNVPTGVDTKVGFGAGGFLLTNDPATFTLDQDSVAPNPYGLGIHSDGFYLLGFTVLLVDVAGFRVANPETFDVRAQDSANGATYIASGLILGSVDSVGLHPVDDPTTSAWSVSWWVTVAVHGSTGTRPVVLNVLQGTGQTLKAQYPNVVAERLSTSTLGL